MSLSYFFCACFFFFFSFSGITQNLLLREKLSQLDQLLKYLASKPGQIQVLMGIELTTKVMRATELSANREFQILLNHFT